VCIDNKKNLDDIQPQFQVLLDRTFFLRSLSFGAWPPFYCQIPSMEITSVSVRRLNLQGFDYDNDWRCFDEEQCI
jgi:hypothetical protein